MKAVRKISLFVLVAFVAVFALGAFTSSAEAGGCHSYGFSSYPSYGHSHAVHKHYDYHYPVSYWPTYDYVKPISYPATYYDCYGRPYVVWQTSYSYTP
jgi:hypothetical protein